MPMGTTAYEHRRIATRVPVWDADKCVECTECSLVCPHAAIRPFLLDKSEAEAAPDGLICKDAHGSPALSGYKFRIQNYTDDCLGCSSCSLICPGHALTMTPVSRVADSERQHLEWLRANVTPKDTLLPAPQSTARSCAHRVWSSRAHVPDVAKPLTSSCSPSSSGHGCS